MEQAIRIRVIQFPGENPLPYVPALIEWTDHVRVCVPCAHVDQLAKSGRDFNPMDLCEGGAHLQLTVKRRIEDQHQISRKN